ncbi:spore gernimation protein GerA [Paenibacillus sp. LMG 31460]|uniref:Spore gernimation protein GerA n=1 Tax=Paenibacillus germinis TaxID=2654979 RepID=A0ABX1Z9V7_9BACL|nr:spore germination protein [Paenibacillus germinis]NOU89059.1 spore gernimation protein GerA [Paenibacillus germinis]
MNLTETTDMARLKLQFESNSDFVMERKQLLGQEVVFCYFRPFVSLAQTNQLLSWMESSPISDWLQQISLLNGKLNATYDLQMSSLMEGYLIIYLLDNPIRNFIIKPVSSTIKRMINVPQNENVIESSFGAFNEDLDTNMALIRDELRSPTLTMNTLIMGTKQPKRTTLTYLSDSVNRKLLSSLMKKLEANKAKEFKHLQEIIKVLGEGNFSLISPCLTSERPAEAADHLKNGRVILFIEGLPYAFVMPVIITDLWCLNSDRNFPKITMITIRMLRFIGMFIALVLPALYVSLVSVNPEVLRIQLALSVAQSREGVPYPAFLEVIFMLIVLEMLIEASIRLPKSIGPSITTVGGIILGQAVVSAKLVSNLFIIVLAASALANFTLNGVQNALFIRISKYVLIVLSAIFGVLGTIGGIIWLSIYMASIATFEVAYVNVNVKEGPQDG